MIYFNQDRLDRYRVEDVVLRWLETATQNGDERYASHRWLLESLPKRMIFHAVYGDLFASEATRRKVLDVGGGFSALTRVLVRNHDYQLVDLLAHDARDCLAAAQAALGADFWVGRDWHEFVVDGTYDVVIANDLFPNVDQRLELFLNRFLPACGEVRLALTYYNESRWYRVRRTDGDEILHVLSWNGQQLKQVLEQFSDRMDGRNLVQLLTSSPSLFDNGRQVMYVRLRGERLSR